MKIFSDKDGILRVSGRIENAPLSYDAKYPVLLPRNHHFTNLVIEKSHLAVKHNGVRETLTQIRTKYWICKGRQIVKSFLSKCVICKRLIGKPYTTPENSPLPAFRVSEDLAFTNIAVDFAGPLYIKDIYSKSQEMQKCYIALFTCASTRAIHLELVPNLLASTFIRALKRFIGRRGIPTQILSDNGKTFTDKMVQNFVNNLGIRWRFNVPTASWWGGFFEICVKLTKRCLRKILGNARLNYEELETLLIETEGVLNSRPLTYVYESLTESPLTPSSLVCGRRLLDIHDITSNVETSNKTSLTKRSKYLQKMLQHFFNRWKKEYLPSLREHTRNKKVQSQQIAKVGDIVHIYKDKIPRQRWEIGKITRVLHGKDGNIRAAEVLTLDKSRKLIHLIRPVQKLYPLEIREIETQGSSEKENDIQITSIRDEDVVNMIQRH